MFAKEYVAAKTDLNGALILSRFTGAAKELTDAVLINPYSTEEFADAIRLAAEMPEEEKRDRMTQMRNTVKTNNIYRWAGNIISEWTALEECLANRPICSRNTMCIVGSLFHSLNASTIATGTHIRITFPSSGR